MKKQLLTLLVCLPLLTMAQGWNKTYEGASGASIQQTTDGGYIVAGYIETSNGANDAFLIKLNAQGDSLWSQSYGGVNYDRVESVQQTTDGGYIMTGRTDGDLIFYSHFDLSLIKTDGNGNEIWSKEYGLISPGINTSDYGQSVRQTTDGGYIVTGKTMLTGNGDLYLIKTDDQGDTVWTKTFGGVDINDVGHSVQQTLDGGYIVCGQIDEDSLGSADVYLLKTDGNGIEQWSQNFGDSLVDIAYAVQQTTDGGYVLCGQYSTGVVADFSTWSPDLYVIKTDGNGLEQWSYTYGGAIGNIGRSIKQTPDGGYIVAGRTNSFGGNGWDLYLIKLNSAGVEQWYKTIDNSQYDYCYSIDLTIDGGYVMCGFAVEGLLVVKTDGNGNITFNTVIPISTAKGRLQKITNYLGQETKPIKNIPLLYQYENGTVEKKIIIE